jgi:threonine 3-dehydrogenase
MLAIVKNEPGPGASLQMVDIPEIGPKDVLVKVEATSICGTDLHIYNWDPWAKSRIKVPRIFGHEFAGYIVETGSDVGPYLAVGDYVSAECHVTCGTCYQCQTGQKHICRDYKILGVDFDGAFAEYVKVPGQCIWKNKANMPPEIASIQDPFGNALLTALSADITGKTVLVSGCGSIGLFAVAIAKASGASKVIAVDLNSYRLNIAQKLGANYCFNPSEVKLQDAVSSLTKGDGVDVVLEMTGNDQALKDSLKMLKNGGHLALLGIPTEPVQLDLANDVVFKGVTIHGLTGREIFATWHKTAAFLDGVIDITPVLTHRFSFEDFEQGFAAMNQGQCGKVILYPPKAETTKMVS